jgi:hypothetical protein
MVRGERGGSGFSEQHPEMLQKYYESLQILTEGHTRAMSQIGTDYEDGINDLPTYYPNDFRAGLERLQHEAEKQLNMCAGTSARNIQAAFESTSQFITILLPEDKIVWQQAETQAQSYGPENATVQRTLRAASNPQAEQAMRAALDKIVWQQAETQAQSYGPENATVQRTLRAAFNNNSINIIKALLPKPEPRNERVYETPPRSTPPPLPKKTLLDRLLRRNRHRHQNHYQQQTPPFEGGINFEDYMRQVHEETERMMKDLFDDLFQGAGGMYDVPPFGQSPPRKETNKTPPQTERDKADQEAREIVRTVIASDRSAQWLASTDIKAVRRVIATVRVLRSKAEEKGEAISDRDIYIRYRRIVETNADASPEIKESLHILTAFMGGSPKGNLPF